MYPQPQGWHPNREGKVYLSASRRSGARVDGMVNLGECSTKRRYVEQAKDAERLEPKRHHGGYRVCGLPYRGQQTPSAERADLPHLVIYAEHGKPVILPIG
jgi:hypothetical protein